MYDVIMLQETKLTTEEYGQITARAEKHSYKVYMAEGLQTKNRWGQLTPLGGVVTMVRMEAKQKLVWEKKGENQQLLAVKVEEWTMINGYAPPHPNDKMLLAAMLQEMMISERLDQPEKKWALAGDWNDEWEDSAVAAIANYAGGIVVRRKNHDTEKGTRWSSDREIDWWATSESGATSEATALSTKIADHKGIWVELSTGDLSWKTGMLRKKPKYNKPESMPMETWKLLVRDIWEGKKNTEERKLLEEVATNPTDDLEQEWTLFQQCLENTYQEAMHHCLEHGLHSPGAEEEAIRDALNTKTRKGGQGDHMWKRHSSNRPCCTNSGKERRDRRKLARSEHLEQELKKGRTPDPKLLKKVLKKNADVADPLPRTKQIKKDLAESLKKLEEEEKKKRMQGWRGRMQTVQGISRWAKSRDKVAMPIINDGQGNFAGTRHEAVTMVINHWKKTWNRFTSEQDKKQKIDDAKKIFETAFADTKELAAACCFKTRPSEEAFEEKAKNASGAGGPDGWTSDEVKAAPPGAIRLFCRLTQNWEKHRRAPKGLEVANQKNLVKEKKIKFLQNKPTLAAADTRPISIFSVWWRLWASVWATSKQIQEWRDRFCPDEIVGGAGSLGSEEVAAWFAEMLAALGYGGTLDYTQCYDMMIPEIVGAAMRAAGLPEDVAYLVENTWASQRRWMEVEKHVDPTPMDCGSALPQGDPWGPLMLNIFMWAGMLVVQQQLQDGTPQPDTDENEEAPPVATTKSKGRGRPKAKAKTATTAKSKAKAKGTNKGKTKPEPETSSHSKDEPKETKKIHSEQQAKEVAERRQKQRREQERKYPHEVYMDDRTWAAENPKASIEPKEAWSNFSKSVLLIENASKTQFMAVQKTKKATLAKEVRKEGMDDKEVVRDYMEVLGCEMSQSTARKMSEKETKKLAKAGKMAQLVGSLPIGHKQKAGAIRVLALSKATYGWVTREVHSLAAQGVFNKTLKAMNAAWARRSNPFLKAALVGGTMHLRSITAQRIIGMAQSMRWRTSRVLTWNLNPGGFVCLLRKTLKRLNWTEEEDFKWSLGKEEEDDEPLMTIDLGKTRPTETNDEKRHKKKLAHYVRESWRRQQWNGWMKAKGRIPEQIREAGQNGHDIQYDEERFTRVRRKFETDDGTVRAILAGAVMSPACFEEPCLWPGCNEPLGHWRHVCWQCPHRPEKLDMPECPFEQRLGWAPVKDKGSRWEALNWLKTVTEAIWEKRYDNAKKRKQRLDRIEKKKQENQTPAGNDDETEEDDESDEEAASGGE